MSFIYKNGLHTISFIEKQEDLNSCLSVIVAANSIAIDLEFDHNLFRYGFQLCLIQIATENACFVIDPITIKNLEPLWKCLRNPQQLKILHAGGEDIRLLKTVGCAMTPIFDTEIASKLLNFPKISLQNLLTDLLEVNVEKTLQKSDWGKRPLTNQQIFYAANDVIYLHKIHDILKPILESKQLTWIFEQECMALAAKEVESEQKKFLDTYSTCSDYELFILRKLVDLREGIAKKLNKPAYQIFHNDVIWLLLKEPKQTLGNWYEQKGLHPKVKTDDFIGTLEELLEDAHEEATKKELSTQWKGVHRPSTARRLQMEEEKANIFMPIRNKLNEKYGEQAISLILSKKLIDALIENHIKISQLKPYQQQLMEETAKELGVTLANYY